MDSRAEYRQTIASLGRNGETVISPTFRKSLDSLIQRLSLSLRDAAGIEDEVLSIYSQYEKELVNRGLESHPLSERDKQQLKVMRQVLGLSDADVSNIEAIVFSLLAANQKGNSITATGNLISIGSIVAGFFFPPAIPALLLGFAGGAITSGVGKNIVRLNTYEEYMFYRYGENWKQ